MEGEDLDFIMHMQPPEVGCDSAAAELDFHNAHVTARKDVERAFGIFQA
jgi:hypothetical protein